MSTLSDAVIARIGVARLVGLTRESGASTSIDSNVLLAACDDAQGDFERITGIAFDDTNKSHLAIVIQGVIFFLEDYKGRDGGIMTGHGKRFYSACEAMRSRVFVSPASNSTLTPSTEQAGAQPDFDRAKNVWRGASRIQTVGAISTNDGSN